jgi:beta-glucosidase
VPARYSLGYGLSYTSFEVSDLSVDEAALQQHGEKFIIRANISNVGARAGRFIAQVYGLTSGNDFPSRVLLGFKPIDLEQGQSNVVEISCSTRPLQRWKDGAFALVDQEFDVELASCSGDAEALKTRVHV